MAKFEKQNKTQNVKYSIVLLKLSKNDQPKAFIIHLWFTYNLVDSYILKTFSYVCKPSQCGKVLTMFRFFLQNAIFIMLYFYNFYHPVIHVIIICCPDWKSQSGFTALTFCDSALT